MIGSPVVALPPPVSQSETSKYQSTGQRSFKSDPPSLTAYLNELVGAIDDFFQESIVLAAENVPDAVKRRFNFSFVVSPVQPKVDTQKGKESASKIFTPTDFSEAYQFYDGRILLLGTPGAGKTTTLFTFARDIAQRRLQGDTTLPVPIIVSLHEWEPETSIAEWAKLNAQLPNVGSQNLLYLLDGLDELGVVRPVDPVRPKRDQHDPRLRLIQQVEQQLSEASVVVTCRLEDYNALGEKIALLGAVALLPLTNEVMRSYLQNSGYRSLWHHLDADASLCDVARTPLLLGLLMEAFGQDDAQTKHATHGLLKSGSIDIPEERIFDYYITRRFSHELSKAYPLPFGQKETRSLLTSIAEYMCGDVSRSAVTISTSKLRALIGPKAEAFLSFARRMHFLRQTNRFGNQSNSDFIEFIHLRFRDYCAVPGFIAKLNHSDNTQRRLAIGALVQIGSLSIPALSEALVQDQTKLGPRGGGEYALVRWAVAEVLMQIGVAAVPALAQAARNLAGNGRHSAVWALSNIKDISVIPTLNECLGDGDREICLQALKGFREILHNSDLFDSPKNFLSAGTTKALIGVLDDLDDEKVEAAEDLIWSLGLRFFARVGQFDLREAVQSSYKADFELTIQVWLMLFAVEASRVSSTLNALKHLCDYSNQTLSDHDVNSLQTQLEEIGTDILTEDEASDSIYFENGKNDTLDIDE